MSDDLRTYARKLDQALAKKEPFFEYNRDIWHATIVVCLAMHHATRKVRILSNELDERLYGGEWFLEEAKAFAAKEGASLDILVESHLPDNHPIWEVAKVGNTTVRRVPDDLQKRYSYNFLLADDSGYRFERDRQSPKAVVVFNDEKDLDKGMKEDLVGVFTFLNDRSDEILPP